MAEVFLSASHALVKNDKPLILLLPHFYLTDRTGVRDGSAAVAIVIDTLAAAAVVHCGVHAAAVLKTIDIAHPLSG